MPRIRTMLIALALVALTVAPAGCRSSQAAQLTSAWPVANSERTVPKPPTPPKWPLTGLPADSEEATTRRVVSVKIENSPAARPQTGLNSADVVYETVVEGGITRFNALFHSSDPTVAGPVRSARLSDLFIVPQYGAVFFYSGASYSINRQVNAAGIENMSQDNGVGRPYYRDRSRNAPHNLYLTMATGREEAQRRGYPTTQNVKPLRFGRSPDTSQTATEITIPLSDSQTTRWAYDPNAKVYLRSEGSNRSIDAASGEQVRARNVVVMWARYRASGQDKSGSTTYGIELVGSGRATVFRDGKRYNGSWEAKRSAPPVFTAEDGSTIRLAPGTTWIEVVDTTVNISMK